MKGGSTDVKYGEENHFRNTMFNNTVHKVNLETEILRDSSGYRVHRVKDAFRRHMMNN